MERSRKVNRKIKGEGRVAPKVPDLLPAERPSATQLVFRLFGAEGRGRAVPGRTERLGSVVLSTALVTGAVLTLSAVARLNVSPSAPLGLYRAVHQPVARGDLVVACVPPAAARLGRERGYLGQGSCPGGVQPVLKRVGAMPGDTIDLGPAAVVVNGVPLPGSDTGVLDLQGRPLPHAPWGPSIVRPDEVWLLTTDWPRSWDSRYFGPVRLDQLRVARPLLTIGGPR
jgi:conjugative transfer signal peptidase TraF